MMEGSMESGGKNVCRCPHHWAIPAATILFGVLFLLGALQVVGADTVNIVWPILVIIAGATKWGEGACKCC